MLFSKDKTLIPKTINVRKLCS